MFLVATERMSLRQEAYTTARAVVLDKARDVPVGARVCCSSRDAHGVPQRESLAVLKVPTFPARRRAGGGRVTVRRLERHEDAVRVCVRRHCVLEAKREPDVLAGK